MNTRAAAWPSLSVVVPTINETAAIGGILSDLAALTVPYEAIVADGGSADDTVEVARAAGARVLRVPPGRGAQLRAGADAARASVLCFLHADVRLGRSAVDRLSSVAVTPSSSVAAFRLRIDAAGLGYRVVEAGANLRTRLIGLPYGDQGLIVRRDDYDRAGGYPPIPLMEDVALMRAMRGIARVRLLDAEILVSPRRWRRDGVVRRTLTNWLLLGRYLAGAPPEQLAKRYRPEHVP